MTPDQINQIALNHFRKVPSFALDEELISSYAAAITEATAELQRELDALKSKPVNLELLAAHDRWCAMAEGLAFTVLMQCDEHSINCNCNLCSALARFNALKEK